MKYTLMAVVILIIGILAVLELRYIVIVDTPVVAKVDRLTGRVWIANKGAWSQIKHETNGHAAPAIPAKSAGQTK